MKNLFVILMLLFYVSCTPKSELVSPLVEKYNLEPVSGVDALEVSDEEGGRILSKLQSWKPGMNQRVNKTNNYIDLSLIDPKVNILVKVVVTYDFCEKENTFSDVISMCPKTVNDAKGFTFQLKTSDSYAYCFPVLIDWGTTGVVKQVLRINGKVYQYTNSFSLGGSFTNEVITSPKKRGWCRGPLNIPKNCTVMYKYDSGPRDEDDM